MRLLSWYQNTLIIYQKNKINIYINKNLRGIISTKSKSTWQALEVTREWDEDKTQHRQLHFGQGVTKKALLQ